MRSLLTVVLALLAFGPRIVLAQQSIPPNMPLCYDPRPAICTARIAPCWADYEIVTDACKRTRGCSVSLIARVTADWNKVLETCTHTGMRD